VCWRQLRTEIARICWQRSELQGSYNVEICRGTFSTSYIAEVLIVPRSQDTSVRTSVSLGFCLVNRTISLQMHTNSMFEKSETLFCRSATNMQQISSNSTTTCSKTKLQCRSPRRRHMTSTEKEHHEEFCVIVDLLRRHLCTPGRHPSCGWFALMLWWRTQVIRRLRVTIGVDLRCVSHANSHCGKLGWRKSVSVRVNPVRNINWPQLLEPSAEAAWPGSSQCVRSPFRCSTSNAPQRLGSAHSAWEVRSILKLLMSTGTRRKEHNYPMLEVEFSLEDVRDSTSK